jgi:hypothetical protein
MTIISEDTPEGGSEELQWKINALTDVHERVKAELEQKRRDGNALVGKLNEAQDRYDTLTSRLTVGVLRKAGFTVDIELADVCDACGEEYS